MRAWISLIREWSWHSKLSSVIESEIYLPSPGVMECALTSGVSFAAAIFKKLERFVCDL